MSRGLYYPMNICTKQRLDFLGQIMLSASKDSALLEIPSSILTSQIAYRISKCRIADYIKLCLEAPHKRCPDVDKLLAFLASGIGKPSS